MAWTIPDKGEGADNKQSVLFQEDLEILLEGLSGTNCVLGGCAVTAQGSPDMTCAVAKGSILSNGVLLPVTAGNVTITTADATNPRIDLVVANSSGTKAVRAGTPAAHPKPPARTANDVVLAQVWVPAGDTTISSTQIVDKRVIQTKGPIEIHKVTAPVTFNTTSTIQTYLTITIPSGLLDNGRIIRVRCGGHYLGNSGTSTWTLTLAFGGTTVFADVTGATTNDADRGAWWLEFYISATAANAQRLTGLCSFQTPGAKGAPATGTGGDLSVTTSINTPLRGSVAVDTSTLDRALTVQWTHSVNNVSVETVMDHATVELF